MIPRLPLLLATTNPNKVREFQSLFASLRIAMLTAAELGLALPSVAEEGDSAAENARLKATQVARQLGRWTLADDTVLEVDSLAGRPGVFTGRYAGPAADMAANRAKLLAELAAQPPGGRGARFVCHLCVADPTGAVRCEAQGECRGEILESARGEGFGYDSLFFLPELGKTMAELGEAERRHVTHRGAAVAALAARFP